MQENLRSQEELNATVIRCPTTTEESNFIQLGHNS